MVRARRFALEFTRERRFKIISNVMIVIPSEVRMYHQWHLNWRKTLLEVNPLGKMKMYMNKSHMWRFLAISLTVSTAVATLAQEPMRRTLNGHRPAAAAHLQPLGPLAETNRLNLVIGLPLRQQETLTGLLKQLYDPTATNFQQWLTPAQFTQRFGPTEQDYLKVIGFAQAHGLTVTRQHSNRAYLDVAGTVADIQKAFRVKLLVYRHQTENRAFYAPNTEPSVESDIPILHVSGLENSTLPQPLGLHIRAKASAASSNQGMTPYYATGSGPNGDFMGKDFRAAYAPGVTNVGAGQYVAIIDLGGAYYRLIKQVVANRL